MWRTKNKGFLFHSNEIVLQMMYQNMRDRMENVVHKRSICHDYITNGGEGEAFNRWTNGFTPQNQPSVIQVCFLLPKNSKSICNNKNISNYGYTILKFYGYI